ncbi:mCG146067, partial [Mus musculus]
SQHSGGRGRWISEFKASLVYKVSSRIARATQRNPVWKNQKKKIKKKLLFKKSKSFYYLLKSINTFVCLVFFLLFCFCFCFALVWFGFWFFETGFLCIALAFLELTL